MKIKTETTLTSSIFIAWSEPGSMQSPPDDGLGSWEHVSTSVQQLVYRPSVGCFLPPSAFELDDQIKLCVIALWRRELKEYEVQELRRENDTSNRDPLVVPMFASSPEEAAEKYAAQEIEPSGNMESWGANLYVDGKPCQVWTTDDAKSWAFGSWGR